jgi:hypothetical protein
MMIEVENAPPIFAISASVRIRAPVRMRTLLSGPVIKFRLSEKDSTAPNHPGMRNYISGQAAAMSAKTALLLTKCHFGTGSIFGGSTPLRQWPDGSHKKSLPHFCYSD